MTDRLADECHGYDLDGNPLDQDELSPEDERLAEMLRRSVEDDPLAGEDMHSDLSPILAPGIY